jgi:hypothetical protein
MFNFIKGKIQRWSASQQRQELVYFNDMIRGSDIETRAMIVATAAHIKNTVIISDEFIESKNTAMDGLFLINIYRKLQKENLHGIATGVSVWIHTNRANYEISNRFIVQEMWSMLKTSFYCVEQGAINVQYITGIKLDISEFYRMPIEYDWIILE